MTCSTVRYVLSVISCFGHNVWLNRYLLKSSLFCLSPESSNRFSLSLQLVGGSTEKMVQFLQSSVGIIHKSHAESIASFVKDNVVRELKEESEVPVMQPAKDRRITFCVEGNISVGKSTFLQKIANETVELRDLVEIVPEPVSKWQDVGPDHFNILGAFYAEPQRYAYTFQNYVFVTRLMQEKESCGGIKPLRLVERSIFSDRMVCLFLLAP